MLCPDRLEQSALIVHTADYFRSQLKTYVLKTFVAGLLSRLSRVIKSLLTYLLTYLHGSRPNLLQQYCSLTTIHNRRLAKQIAVLI